MNILRPRLFPSYGNLSVLILVIVLNKICTSGGEMLQREDTVPGLNGIMRNSWSVCCQGLDEWSDVAVMSAVRTCLKLDSHFPIIKPWGRANLEVSALQHWNLYHNSKLSISHTPKCDHKMFSFWGFLVGSFAQCQQNWKNKIKIFFILTWLGCKWAALLVLQCFSSFLLRIESQVCLTGYEMHFVFFF